MTDDLRPVVAAFDLDGTLTDGGSVFPWLVANAGLARVYRASLRLAVPLIVGGLRSGAAADQAKERLFRATLQGRSADHVSAVSREFAREHLDHEGRPAVMTRLTWHLEQGHDVVLVSASPELYVGVMAEQLRAHGFCGTRLAVDPRGNLTGSYLGRNCRGTEKMRRLDEWITGRGYATTPLIYAYGNSRGDRRMLECADRPFNVGKLGPLSRLRRFPRLAA